jgi:hypothetical protein
MVENQPARVFSAAWSLMAKLNSQERCGLWALFSPDSQRLAYVAYVDGGKSAVVLDSTEGDRHAGVLAYGYGFSSDSARFAYAATTGKQDFIVVDGEAARQYEEVLPPAIYWSPDARHVAYAVRNFSGPTVVIDATEGPPYGIVGGIIFDGPERLHYIGFRGFDLVLVEETLVASGDESDRRQAQAPLVPSPEVTI